MIARAALFPAAAHAARALRSPAQRSEARASLAIVFALTLAFTSFAADNPRPRSRNASTPAPSAAPTPGQPDFEAFRIVAERNIFNPNRVGRSRGADDAPPPRVENIALVGTMESGSKGLQAFFDSSEAGFRKAVREGDELAGYTVRKIHVDRVELAAGEKAVTLALMQQLRRTGGGEWTVSAREQPRPAATAATPAAEPPPIPAGASDLLRRLMEQRQKQLKQ